MKTILFIIFLFLLSCEKAPTRYDMASKGDYVEWHIQTGCYTQIVIDGWGMAQCNGNRIQDPILFVDSNYKMDAWDRDRNILGMTYDVWIYTDSGWGFVGEGVTKIHNDIINIKQ